MELYNTTAENAVLGSILLDNDCIDKITLTPEDFYHERNKVFFRAMQEMYSQGERIDYLTLQEKLNKEHKLDDVGGLQAIMYLTNATPTSGNIKEHAKIVLGKSTLRKITILAENAKVMCEQGEEPQDVTDKLQADLNDIGRDNQEDAGHSLAEILLENRDVLSQKLHNPNYAITTGFTDLDRILNGGLQPTDLVVLAGRPAMGKTALGLNIVYNASRTSQKRCLVFSLEMGRIQLLNRLASLSGGIENGKLARPTTMTREDWQSYKNAADRLRDMPIRIIDRGKATPSSIRRQAKAMIANGGLDLIMIDYLGLMHSDRQRDNKVTEVADMTRDLKELAKELNVPIILLCQLNRLAVGRNDKRPIMSDLRDSGSIEQDADVVMLLHREDYYVPDTKMKNVAEVIVAKHRNGETGTIMLYFNGKFTAFGNMTQQQYTQYIETHKTDNEDENDED